MEDIMFDEVDVEHRRVVEFDKQQCCLFGTTLEERKAALSKYRSLYYAKACQYDGLAKCLFFNQTDPSSMHNDYRDREYQIHVVLRGEVVSMRLCVQSAEEHVQRYYELHQFDALDLDNFDGF